MKITKRQLRRIIREAEDWSLPSPQSQEYRSARDWEAIDEQSLVAAGEKIIQGVADYLTAMIDDRGMSFEGAMKVLNAQLPALVREGSMREP